MIKATCAHPRQVTKAGQIPCAVALLRELEWAGHSSYDGGYVAACPVCKWEASQPLILEPPFLPGEDRPVVVPGTQGMTARQARFVVEYLVDRNATDAAARAGCPVIESHAPDGFYVYALVDTDESIFYVGKGIGRRWMSHYLEKSGVGNQTKRERIRQGAGQRRRCVILAEGVTETEAFTIERETIAALPDLTNIAPGHRSHAESSMAAAQEILDEAISYDEWIAAKPRTPEQIYLCKRVLSELQSMATKGYANRVTFRKVNEGPWVRVGDGRA